MKKINLLTNPNTCNDLLIEQPIKNNFYLLIDLEKILPSFSLSPVAPLLLIFSLPAKSTKFIIDNFSVFFFKSVSIYLNSIVIIVCALEEL